MENKRERPDATSRQGDVGVPLRIAYFNARSIVNKISELKLFSADCMPDVIAITESWTNPNISNEYLKLPNYFIAARYDRNDTRDGRGGGILIYVNDRLQF